MRTIINFSGDMAFSHFESDNIKFCDEISNAFQDGHYNICNLENPICFSKQKKKPKPIVLQCEKLPRVVLDNFDAYSLANNHIFDFYSEGFSQTINYLKQNNKSYFGAGFNHKEATKPLIVNINGISIVLWGITRFENASKNKPGAASDNIKYYKKEIKKYKENGNLVIIYAHWGREYVDYPTPDDRDLAKLLIDSGVDCVIGTHPHVPQGAEIYNGKYIFYSLGNFIFSDEIITDSVAFNKEDSRLNLGYIVQLNIQKDLTYKPTIIPYKTNNGVVTSLGGLEFDDFKTHFIEISLKTNDDNVHVKEFFKAASGIRKQSKKMIKKQITEHGLLSLIDPIKNIRLQDLKIAFYPDIERNFKILQCDNFLSRFYSVFIHKFLTFSVIGLIVTLTTMVTLGLLLGVAMLPLFPTWWIVYLSAIGLSLFLNNKLIFKGNITFRTVLLFFIVYISSMFLGIYLLKLFRNITELPNWLLGYLALPFTLTYNFFFVNKILRGKVFKVKRIDKMQYNISLKKLFK